MDPYSQLKHNWRELLPFLHLPAFLSDALPAPPPEGGGGAQHYSDAITLLTGYALNNLNPKP